MFTPTLICSCVSNPNSDFVINTNHETIENENSKDTKSNKQHNEENNNKNNYVDNYIALQKSLSVSVIQSPEIAIKEKDFNTAYIFQIHDRENKALIDFPISLSYPVSKVNQEIDFAEAHLKTDEKGCINFKPMDTHFSCNSFVYVYPSIQDRENLNENEKEEIKNYIEKNSFRVPYQVKTNLSNIGGSICIADYDKNGKLVTTNGYSTSALSISLRQKGFTGIGNLEFYKEIDDGNTEALLQKVRNLAGAVSFYFIYGKVKYANQPFLNENKQYEVSLDCEISCVVLKTSEILYSTKIQVTGFGNTEAAALNDARNSKMNSLLSEKIIYGM